MKQPEKKKAAAAPETLTIETAIHNTEVLKTGDNKGKPFTLYGIKGDNEIIYKTFSDSLIDLASTAFRDKQRVRISYTTGQYGNNIVNLEVIEEREPGSDDLI